jgi:hypothetical protein
MFVFIGGGDGILDCSGWKILVLKLNGNELGDAACAGRGISGIFEMRWGDGALWVCGAGCGTLVSKFGGDGILGCSGWKIPVLKLNGNVGIFELRLGGVELRFCCGWCGTLVSRFGGGGILLAGGMPDRRISGIEPKLNGA